MLYKSFYVQYQFEIKLYESNLFKFLVDLLILMDIRKFRTGRPEKDVDETLVSIV